MNYDLSAVTMLNKLGYNQPTGRGMAEEYFDLKKDDWVATKSVLKRYGIDHSIIKNILVL